MDALSNIKVGTRLGLNNGLLLLLMMALTLTGITRMALLQHNLDVISQKNFTQIDLVNTMRDAVRFQAIAMRDVVMQEDIAFKKNELKRMKEARKNYLQTSEKLEKILDDAQGMAFLAKIKPLEDETNRIAKEVINYSLSDQTADAGNAIRDKLRPKQLELIVQLEDMLTAVKKATNEERMSAATAYKNAQIFMWSLAAISIVLGVLISAAIARSIVSPLNQAVEVAKNIARGDLTSRVRINGSDEVANLLTALRDMNRNLCEIIGGVQGAAHTVTESSEKLSDAARHCADRAGTQVERVHEISAATEEITVSISEMAEGAASVSMAAARTQSIAQKGDANMSKGVESTRRMVSSVEFSAATVEELNVAIRKITDIAQVIKEIADQTNLLALNAAIEAARAGEQGRGFAVVADEVRKLAERTTSSTMDITHMVGSIGSQTAAAVDSMKQVKQEVHEGESFSLMTRDILHEIVSAADEVSHLAQGIANATREQQAASANTAAGMDIIMAITEENTASLQQVGIAAVNLADTASELTQLVDRFKLPA
ncbi:MAG: methyl-accepting chemotaxis protein [Sulfuricellaceae bacterium]|nr:methyl-accepting chemotaxis protein [Sulfuricellaceae bacterium]